MRPIARPFRSTAGLLATALLAAPAGADDPAALDPAEVERVMRQEVDAFYARAVDPAGGFFEAFDAAWTRQPDADRMIVPQARATWAAAELAQRRPALAPRYRPVAAHGVTYLRDRLWDAEHGGFFWGWDLDADAPHLEGGKHLYGIAFGIYAAANAAAALDDRAARDLAIDAFRWVETHARDREYPGYYEAFDRSGEPILAPPAADPKATDVIGTAFGFKSMNTHIHLMEAYTQLYRVWPDAELRDRLTALFHLVRDRIVVEPGCLNLFFTPDWRAVPAHDSFGHDVETAFLLLETAEALGDASLVAQTEPIARQLVDHALTWGYDDEFGGLYDAGEAFGPIHNDRKVWWVQAEAINALSLMDVRFGSRTDRYADALHGTWAFARAHLVDAELGGWRGEVGRRGEPSDAGDKAHNWKSVYHTVRSLIHLADRLETPTPAAAAEW